MKISTNKVLAICIAVTFLFIYLTRGYFAVRTILMLTVVFILPIFLILHMLKINKENALFYSFFISIGLFGYGVYFINYIAHSLRVSLIVTTLLLYSVGILLYFFNKKHKIKSKE